MRNFLNEATGKAGESPEALARRHARPPLPKRFYKETAVRKLESGEYGIELDGRRVKTPAKATLALPTAAAAGLIAAEFDAQAKVVNPASMSVTRLANTAVDGVAAEPQAVFEDILRFTSSDLLCYRAGHPERLAELQSQAWDPVLDFVSDRFGAQFILAEGVMHVEQPRPAIAAFSAALKRHDSPIALAAIHSMTSLTGSALLAMCVAERLLDAEVAWSAAHIDEDWNISQWGEDAEAAERRRNRRAEMFAAVSLFESIRD